jgi:hypothetical protein
MYLLPSSDPEGDYSLSREEFESLDKSDERETWRTQGAPGVAIFGEMENFKVQVSAQMKNDFMSKMLGVETITLEEAARLDSLAGHSKLTLITRSHTGARASYQSFQLQTNQSWIFLTGLFSMGITQ